jgi:flavin-binding protein dodecin
MPHQFRQESQAVIRRRIGYLLKREKFVYGTATSVPTPTTFVLNEAKTRQTGSLTGCVAYCVSGTGAGNANIVSTNTQGSGLITTTASWGVGLDTTSVIEVWFDSLAPEQVNSAINEAINDAQDQAVVKAIQTNPTLDATRKIITPPATFTRVYALVWQDAGGTWYRARAVNNLDDLPWVDTSQYRFAVHNGTVC